MGDDFTFVMNGYPVYGSDKDGSEPKFVTPVLRTTYFYEKTSSSTQAPSSAASQTLANQDDVLRSYVKIQM